MSDLNSRAGSHHTVPVQLRLEPGDVNTIRFGAIGSEGNPSCVLAVPLTYECGMLLTVIFCLTDFDVTLDGIEQYHE